MTGHIVRVDCIDMPNGDLVGKAIAKSVEARRMLEAQVGVTVLPPLHRPIAQHHVNAFGHAGATLADSGYDVAEKLHKHHEIAWMHPEEWFI